MRHPSLFAATALAAVSIAAAGCGSSSKSTSNAGGYAPVHTTSTQSAAASSTTSASTTPASSTGTAVVVVSTKHDKLGTILTAGSKHLTVYMFEGDKGASSACIGACAKVWPPVTSSAAASASGAAVAADLGTIRRSDGTMQVTYKGHPLYWFARDGDASDAYGQGIVGFGSSWYVISPSGNKVDHS